MKIDNEIVIVGAGPIGLAYAWGFKKLNPKLNVVVLEKNVKYTRDHTLNMQWQQLEKLRKATHTVTDTDLKALQTQLRTDPHIRTNELERIFKKLAEDSGVKIIIEEVKKDSIKEQINNHAANPKLIIGADSTHSVVSSSLFPEGNQVKHEFDYALQLRYDIVGDDKASSVNTIPFLQMMARCNLIAHEHVGHFADGKSPVTMQIIISKQNYKQLEPAKSKTPVKLFRNESTALSTHDLTYDDIPEDLKRFIDKYIEEKIKSCQKHGDTIDKTSIRISVNELPATHAKQIFNNKPTPVLLAGDAALGLSYFKGLNAGLEATAKFFSLIGPAIEEERFFNNKQYLLDSLNEYQTWFLKDFAPKKIAEVANYSTWQVRLPKTAMKVAFKIKGASFDESENMPTDVYKDALAFQTQPHPLTTLNDDSKWRLFPHRKYDPVKLGQFDYVAIRHSLRKIAKLFIDYFKPYKSLSQHSQDYKQPLVGTVNVFSGVVKIVAGLFGFNLSRFSDGIFSLLRGVIEIITTPLTWLIKPITRSVAGKIHGRVKIEENSGIRKVAKYAHKYLDKVEKNSHLDDKATYKLFQLSNDLHRKYEKAIKRGQTCTGIGRLEEISAFNAIREDDKLNRVILRKYFSLFKEHRVKSKEESPYISGNFVSAGNLYKYLNGVS
jgi:2-polyprenyl-6-methoxyphenol hydroxylase-like FAD-dependent oxidoreductase